MGVPTASGLGLSSGAEPGEGRGAVSLGDGSEDLPDHRPHRVVAVDLSHVRRERATSVLPDESQRALLDVEAASEAVHASDHHGVGALVGDGCDGVRESRTVERVGHAGHSRVLADGDESVAVGRAPVAQSLALDVEAEPLVCLRVGRDADVPHHLHAVASDSHAISAMASDWSR